MLDVLSIGKNAFDMKSLIFKLKIPRTHSHFGAKYAPKSYRTQHPKTEFLGSGAAGGGGVAAGILSGKLLVSAVSGQKAHNDAVLAKPDKSGDDAEAGYGAVE